MNIEKTVEAIERFIEGVSEIYQTTDVKDFIGADDKQTAYYNFRGCLNEAMSNLREAATIVSSL